MIIAQCGYYRMRLPLMRYFDNCETGGCAVDSTIVILWVGAILKLRRRWSMHQYLTGKVLRAAGAVL